jgi:hypothetical protein
MGVGRVEDGNEALMPHNYAAIEDRLDAGAEAVAAAHTRKPTISEACDIADEREKKALVAAFVEALRVSGIAASDGD